LIWQEEVNSIPKESITQRENLQNIYHIKEEIKRNSVNEDEDVFELYKPAQNPKT
jgi:hypothetical protein